MNEGWIDGQIKATEARIAEIEQSIAVFEAQRETMRALDGELTKARRALAQLKGEPLRKVEKKAPGEHEAGDAAPKRRGRKPKEATS